MDDSEGPKPRSELWLALQKLARGAGVQRDDLLEALDGELVELRRRWGLDTRKRATEDASELRRRVRGAVIGKLIGHIESLSPPKGKPKSQYAHSVYVSFNALTDKAHADLKGMDLSGRQDWLATKVPYSHRVTTRTSRRNLGRALEQIEAQLLTGHNPESPVEQKATTEALRGHDGKTFVGSSESTDDATSSAKRRRTRWMVVASVTAAGLLIVTAAVVFKPSNPGGGQRAGAASTTPTMPPSVASATDGPVHVDSVTYLRNGTDRSYAFGQNLKLTGADLAGLNRLAGNDAAYQKWALSRGGVNPFDAKIQMVLRGNASQTVVITDVQVAAQCGKPLTGTLLYSPAAAPNGDVGIRFDLDKQYPIAQDANDDDAYFSGPHAHTISLAPGEVTTLLVDALTARQHCAFSFTVVVATGEGHEPVSEKIDDHGKPFQVTATADGGGDNVLKFTDYQAIYAGGTASPSRNGKFALVNPVTLH